MISNISSWCPPYKKRTSINDLIPRGIVEISMQRRQVVCDVGRMTTNVSSLQSRWQKLHLSQHICIMFHFSYLSSSFSSHWWLKNVFISHAFYVAHLFMDNEKNIFDKMDYLIHITELYSVYYFELRLGHLITH